MHNFKVGDKITFSYSKTLEWAKELYKKQSLLKCFTICRINNNVVQITESEYSLHISWIKLYQPQDRPILKNKSIIGELF